MEGNHPGTTAEKQLSPSDSKSCEEQFGEIVQPQPAQLNEDKSNAARGDVVQPSFPIPAAESRAPGVETEKKQTAPTPLSIQATSPHAPATRTPVLQADPVPRSVAGAARNDERKERIPQRDKGKTKQVLEVSSSEDSGADLEEENVQLMRENIHLRRQNTSLMNQNMKLILELKDKDHKIFKQHLLLAKYRKRFISLFESSDSLLVDSESEDEEASDSEEEEVPAAAPQRRVNEATSTPIAPITPLTYANNFASPSPSPSQSIPYPPLRNLTEQFNYNPPPYPPSPYPNNTIGGYSYSPNNYNNYNNYSSSTSSNNSSSNSSNNNTNNGNSNGNNNHLAKRKRQSAGRGRGTALKKSKQNTPMSVDNSPHPMTNGNPTVNPSHSTPEKTDSSSSSTSTTSSAAGVEVAPSSDATTTGKKKRGPKSADSFMAVLRSPSGFSASPPESEGDEGFNYNNFDGETVISGFPVPTSLNERHRKGRKSTLWSAEDDEKFLKAYALYGKSWKLIHTLLPEKTREQVQSHGQYLIRTGKIDDVQKSNRKRRMKHQQQMTG